MLMILKNIRFLSFILVLLYSSVLCGDKPDQQILPKSPDSMQSPVEHSNPGIYESIAQENLKSLSKIELKAKNGFSSTIEDFDKLGFAVIMQNRFQDQLNPPLQAKRRLIFTLLSEYEKKEHPVIATTVLDEKTWQDLELLNGPKSDPSFYLASKLDRSVTEVGRISLFKKIVQPNADIEALQAQQAIVRELVKNEKLFKDLDAKLKELVVPENLTLSFWDSEDIFTFIMSQWKVKFPFNDKVKALSNLSTYLNQNELFQEFGRRTVNTLGTISDLLVLYAAVALPYYAATGKSLIPFMSAEKFDKLAPYSIPGAFCFLLAYVASKRINNGVSATFSTLRNWNIVYYIIDDYRHKNVFQQLYYKKMSNVARFVNNIKDMAQIASQNTVLFEKMPAIKHFKETLVKLISKSKKLEKFLEMLETDDFDQGDEASNWFTMWGRIRASFFLMLDLKENLVPAMLAVGELDAQLSIAKLYKEFESKRVHYCFPNYVSGCATPAMQLEDSWNPMVDAEKVVTNSINMGEKFDAKRNVIITGPNAGGKSTIMKSMIMCAILAQSLGIAPAMKMDVTPFNNIITYLNITDDIAAGNSHFKAGVMRARDVINVVDSANNKGFTLTAVDEVFNGTTHKEGQAAAYALIKQLGLCDWNACVTCTHFPMIPQLEYETNVFANYKVSVKYDQNGKIQYPYKLDKGISDQVVTLRILQEDGFGDAFLSQAQQVLDLQKS
jgi:DNA mismatch repair protein MutS